MDSNILENQAAISLPSSCEEGNTEKHSFRSRIIAGSSKFRSLSIARYVAIPLLFIACVSSVLSYRWITVCAIVIDSNLLLHDYAMLHARAQQLSATSKVMQPIRTNLMSDQPLPSLPDGPGLPADATVGTAGSMSLRYTHVTTSSKQIAGNTTTAPSRQSPSFESRETA